MPPSSSRKSKKGHRKDEKKQIKTQFDAFILLIAGEKSDEHFTDWSIFSSGPQTLEDAGHRVALGGSCLKKKKIQWWRHANKR